MKNVLKNNLRNNLKNKLGFLLAAVLALTFLSGCSLLPKKMRNMFGKKEKVESPHRRSFRRIASKPKKPRRVKVYRSKGYFRRLDQLVKVGILKKVRPGVYREVGASRAK